MLYFIRSFGHHQAKQHNVQNGWHREATVGTQDVKHGFCITRQSVTKVTSMLLALYNQFLKLIVYFPNFRLIWRTLT